MTYTTDSLLRPAQGVSASARRLAHVLALITLPSGLWRIALVAGLPVVSSAIVLPLSERVQIVGLSLVAEVLAMLSLGLVQRWGEELPGWLPLIGGRPVHRLAATIPAAVGATALTGIWTFAVVGVVSRVVGGGLDSLFPTALQKAVLLVCYVPLLAWGPLLAVLTVAYFRRRTPGAVRVVSGRD
ncbi:hypothetical protein ACFS27_02100 [Promicromonospora vindobonensis]|uniref:Uncharacterized protein n=1 Tax=Promicromonospora vindobonensis TaxID=195748 RepID=A0ABW5VM98_9MICO